MHRGGGGRGGGVISPANYKTISRMNSKSEYPLCQVISPANYKTISRMNSKSEYPLCPIVSLLGVPELKDLKFTIFSMTFSCQHGQYGYFPCVKYQ